VCRDLGPFIGEEIRLSQDFRMIGEKRPIRGSNRTYLSSGQCIMTLDTPSTGGCIRAGCDRDKPSEVAFEKGD